MTVHLGTLRERPEQTISWSLWLTVARTEGGRDANHANTGDPGRHDCGDRENDSSVSRQQRRCAWGLRSRNRCNGLWKSWESKPSRSSGKEPGGQISEGNVTGEMRT